MGAQIKFKHSGRDFTRYGEMGVCEVDATLNEFRRKAISLKYFFNYDHIIYGAKLYDSRGKLIQVNFYEDLYLNDEEFERRTCGIDGVIYAIHSRVHIIKD